MKDTCNTQKKCKLVNSSLKALLKLARSNKVSRTVRKHKKRSCRKTVRKYKKRSCRKTVRKYKKRSCRKTKSCRKNKRSKRRSCRKSRRFGSRFGMPGLSSIMSNTPKTGMSLDQMTTGMAPKQMFGHLENVDPSLRDTFYV